MNHHLDSSTFNIANEPLQNSFSAKLITHTTRYLRYQTGSIRPAAAIILIYGACHAAAWNTHFPSTLECWLWRVSATVVAVVPTYFIVFRYYATIGRSRAKFFYSPLRFPRKRISQEGEALLFLKRIEDLHYYLFLALVICSRVFLLVESFICLRRLPEGSFQTTVWDGYWPHL